MAKNSTENNLRHFTLQWNRHYAIELMHKAWHVQYSQQNCHTTMPHLV